ncbi:Ig-like domain-containing protein [Rhizomicrobium electricum]|uniref:SbsA Ig-like domain-containing protein n=1 Tax=Rhizomicrobium electricum TaxID=480070 RepID=A0ABN1EMN1_9PROT|nr:Ig-like domain-containing protein [Rhizomicrobium electricum]NIJ46943.1 Ca2+-binding RTX toxin-like protein [Rhizomicrobium electricum]
MTTVTNLVSGGNGFYDSDLSVIASTPLTSQSATSFTLSDTGYSITVTGTGLTYSNGHVSGGTITGLSISNSTGIGMASQTWSGFSLSAATVWSAITSGNTAQMNSLFFGGNDTFTGSGSLISFYGFGGDDTFNVTLNGSSQFLPSIDGGSGYDTLNLSGPLPGATQSYTGTPLTTWIKSIEKIKLGAGNNYSLTTYYSDSVLAAGETLTVDASALGAGNTLKFDGSSETDGAFILTGGAGNDTLRGGGGNDTIDGGAGTDTLYLGTMADGVTLDLNLTTAQSLGNLGTDTIRNIENVYGSGTLIGTSGNNTFSVTSGANSIDGGAGIDTLNCAGLYSATVDLSQTGPQHIDANSGLWSTLKSIENVIGTGQNDTFVGNASDNTFDGGSGFDRVSLADSTTGVTIDMRGANPVVTGATGIGNDTYISIEGFVGTNYDDTFVYGGDYSTSQLAYATLDGGDGNDTIDFSHCTSGIGIELSSPKYASIENVIGTAYADQISAPFGTGTHTIDAGAGNDRILMSRGTNVVKAGDGDDIIFMDGDELRDQIDGGAGSDTVYYSNSSSGLDVFAANRITNVETLLLSNSDAQIQFNDGNVAAGATLTIRYRDDSPVPYYPDKYDIDGSAETDGRFDITTLGGNDTLIGGAGADNLKSGGGDDTLKGNGGNDIIDGGAGADTVLYSGNRADYTITFTSDTTLTVAGPDGTDSLSNVEYLQFADQKVSTDRTAPTLTDQYPKDDATDVLEQSGFSLTFSENVKAGTGNIVFHKADGTVVATLDITNSQQVTISANRITLTPNAQLESLTSYYITIDAGAITDLSGNAYAGITSPTAYNFTTAFIADTAPPQLISSTPANYNVGVATDTNLVLTFSEAMKTGTGNITVRDAQTSAVLLTIAATDTAQVAVSGTTVTINPTGTIPAGHDCTVTFDHGAITDLAGNSYEGSIVFTTVPNTITGSTGDDILAGTGINDAIFGLDGNDTLTGGGGTNTLNGGAGIDTVSYAGNATAVNADLTGGIKHDIPSSNNNDVLVNIENLIGSSYGDILQGDAGANVLDGGDGSDALYGLDGNDTLIGGRGNDSLVGGAGTDTMVLSGRPDQYVVQWYSNTNGEFYSVFGPDGSDIAYGMEFAKFSDGRTLSMADFQAQSFDPLAYIASYKDLIQAFGDDAQWGLSHYLNNGFAEGRTTTFNALNYICSYGDLVVAFHDDKTAAEEHYLKNGYYEGRKVTFDPLAYVCSYSDLLIAFHDDKTAAAEHYIKNGYWENRKVTFDALAYVCSYDDLVIAFHNDKTAAEEHYIRNGYWEGRKVTFNALAYIASYNDLIGAFGDDVQAAEEHYIRNGFWEGRKVTFDPVAYLINNTDLGTCGFTATDVTEHYLKNGYWEHRTTNGAFGSEQTNHDLTVGSSVTDTIGTTGDKDWFAVSVTAGQTYTFTLSGVDGGNGTLADPFLSICDAHGVQLTYANDSTNHDAVIRFTALSTGTCYLVASANDTGTGSYKLFATAGG